MNPNYEKALKRQLVSTPKDPDMKGITFQNQLPIAVRLQWINTQGVLVNFGNVPNKSEELAPGVKVGEQGGFTLRRNASIR